MTMMYTIDLNKIRTKEQNSEGVELIFLTGNASKESPTGGALQALQVFANGEEEKKTTSSNRTTAKSDSLSLGFYKDVASVADEREKSSYYFKFSNGKIFQYIKQNTSPEGSSLELSSFRGFMVGWLNSNNISVPAQQKEILNNLAYAHQQYDIAIPVQVALLQPNGWIFKDYGTKATYAIEEVNGKKEVFIDYSLSLTMGQFIGVNKIFKKIPGTINTRVKLVKKTIDGVEKYGYELVKMECSNYLLKCLMEKDNVLINDEILKSPDELNVIIGTANELYEKKQEVLKNSALTAEDKKKKLSDIDKRLIEAIGKDNIKVLQDNILNSLSVEEVEHKHISNDAIFRAAEASADRFAEKNTAFYKLDKYAIFRRHVLTPSFIKKCDAKINNLFNPVIKSLLVKERENSLNSVSVFKDAERGTIDSLQEKIDKGPKLYDHGGTERTIKKLKRNQENLEKLISAQSKELNPSEKEISERFLVCGRPEFKSGLEKKHPAWRDIIIQSFIEAHKNGYRGAVDRLSSDILKNFSQGLDLNVNSLSDYIFDRISKIVTTDVKEADVKEIEALLYLDSRQKQSSALMGEKFLKFEKLFLAIKDATVRSSVLSAFAGHLLKVNAIGVLVNSGKESNLIKLACESKNTNLALEMIGRAASPIYGTSVLSNNNIVNLVKSFKNVGAVLEKIFKKRWFGHDLWKQVTKKQWSDLLSIIPENSEIRQYDHLKGRFTPPKKEAADTVTVKSTSSTSSSTAGIMQLTAEKSSSPALDPTTQTGTLASTKVLNEAGNSVKGAVNKATASVKQVNRLIERVFIPLKEKQVIEAKLSDFYAVSLNATKKDHDEVYLVEAKWKDSRSLNDIIKKRGVPNLKEINMAGLPKFNELKAAVDERTKRSPSPSSSESSSVTSSVSPVCGTR